MKTKEYRQTQLKQIKLDKVGLGENYLQNEYYKASIKFWDYKGNSTNSLNITNEEFNQIKAYLLKKSAEKLG